MRRVLIEFGSQVKISHLGWWLMNRKDGCVGTPGALPDVAGITELGISSPSALRSPQVTLHYSSTGTTEFSLFSEGIAR